MENILSSQRINNSKFDDKSRRCIHESWNNSNWLFQKKNIILGSKEINITDDILKIMNDKIKEVNIKWQSH